MKTALSRFLAITLSLLMLFSLTACGNEPTTPENDSDPPQTGEVTPVKIAVNGKPARSVAVNWYYDEAIRTPYREFPFEELVFQADAPDALAGLADGTYDVAILPCVRGETPDFGTYDALPLLDDAIIFVHGNPTAENAGYDLALETIRAIYGDGGEFYWDEAQSEPLIPSFWFEDLAQPLDSLFGIESTAGGILSSEGYTNPIWAAQMNGLDGSPLFPVYHSFLGGDAGINGVVISVDGVLPTESTIADGTYPLAISYYAVYAADNPNASAVAAQLQIVAQ